jgi:hypothetical protein
MKPSQPTVHVGCHRSSVSLRVVMFCARRKIDLSTCTRQSGLRVSRIRVRVPTTVNSPRLCVHSIRVRVSGAESTVQSARLPNTIQKATNRCRPMLRLHETADTKAHNSAAQPAVPCSRRLDSLVVLPSQAISSTRSHPASHISTAAMIHPPARRRQPEPRAHTACVLILLATLLTLTPRMAFGQATPPPSAVNTPRSFTLEYPRDPTARNATWPPRTEACAVVTQDHLLVGEPTRQAGARARRKRVART